MYNVSAYMDFHPGGIPEMMRGAGKDATSLFDEVGHMQCSLRRHEDGSMAKAHNSDLHFSRIVLFFIPCQRPRDIV